MPEELTPITREETYLSAIAGEDVSVPDPIIRKEEFLAAIDEHIGDVEGDVTDAQSAITALQTQVPASTAADAGKVLTAGSTAGTAGWQTAGLAVPVPAAADDGKVLTASDDGTASWKAGGAEFDYLMNSTNLNFNTDHSELSAELKYTDVMQRMRSDYANGRSVADILARFSIKTSLTGTAIFNRGSGSSFSIVMSGYSVLRSNGADIPVYATAATVYINLGDTSSAILRLNLKKTDNTAVPSDLSFGNPNASVFYIAYRP